MLGRAKDDTVQNQSKPQAVCTVYSQVEAGPSTDDHILPTYNPDPGNRIDSGELPSSWGPRESNKC